MTKSQILVVDDEADIRELLGMTLLRMGLDAHCAASIAEGDAQAQRALPVLIGASPAMQATRALIDRLARSQAPIHISGESGSGKELAARLIHLNGSRQDGSFIAVNCGAIPENLMESE